MSLDRRPAAAPPPIITEAVRAALVREAEALRRYGGDASRGLPEARIAAIESLLGGATVVADTAASSIVCVGSVVDVEFPRTGRRMRYRLTAGGPAPVDAAAVSPRSPVGQAIMGAAEDDLVELQLPGGHVEELRVLRIVRC